MNAYHHRMTELTVYCPKHIAGFTAYHVGYELVNGKQERVFACSFCGHEFTESHQHVECDPR
jgi:hypothetical protein